MTFRIVKKKILKDVHIYDLPDEPDLEVYLDQICRKNAQDKEELQRITQDVQELPTSVVYDRYKDEDERESLTLTLGQSSESNEPDNVISEGRYEYPLSWDYRAESIPSVTSSCKYGTEKLAEPASFLVQQMTSFNDSKLGISLAGGIDHSFGLSASFTIDRGGNMYAHENLIDHNKFISEPAGPKDIAQNSESMNNESDYIIDDIFRFSQKDSESNDRANVNEADSFVLSGSNLGENQSIIISNVFAEAQTKVPVVESANDSVAVDSLDDMIFVTKLGTIILPELQEIDLVLPKQPMAVIESEEDVELIEHHAFHLQNTENYADEGRLEYIPDNETDRLPYSPEGEFSFACPPMLYTTELKVIKEQQRDMNFPTLPLKVNEEPIEINFGLYRSFHRKIALNDQIRRRQQRLTRELIESNLGKDPVLDYIGEKWLKCTYELEIIDNELGGLE